MTWSSTGGSLANIALKAGRLARLLNDFETQQIMQWEAGGYPTTPNGFPPESWNLAMRAGRVFMHKKDDKSEATERAYHDSIDSLEQEVRSQEAKLAAARDPDSPPTPTPGQSFWPGNSWERHLINQAAKLATTRLASRRAFIYQYVTQVYYELRFSAIAEDVFSRIRQRVDSVIGQVIPEAVKKITAVYGNLSSQNTEDWAMAVHGCRRIICDLADKVFPPQKAPSKESHPLGKENYKNRIIEFAESKATSEKYREVVGSNLSFLCDRLDSIWEAASKGTHSEIVTRDEAERYVVYTYLLVGDILSLYEPALQAPAEACAEVSLEEVFGDAEDRDSYKAPPE